MEKMRDNAVSFIVVSFVGIGEVIVDTREFCDDPWDDARLQNSCLCVAGNGLRHAAGKMHQTFFLLRPHCSRSSSTNESNLFPPFAIYVFFLACAVLRCTCSFWLAPSCDDLRVCAAVISFVHRGCVVDSDSGLRLFVCLFVGIKPVIVKPLGLNPRSKLEFLDEFAQKVCTARPCS